MKKRKRIISVFVILLASFILVFFIPLSLNILFYSNTYTLMEKFLYKYNTFLLNQLESKIYEEVVKPLETIKKSINANPFYTDFILPSENISKEDIYLDYKVFSRELTSFLTYPFVEDVFNFQVTGVNHGIFMNRFEYNGKNAYPLLDEWIEKKSSEWESENPWDLQLSPAAIDMYKFYGMMPIGDTVRNGSWKYHYNLETKKKWLGKFGGIDNEVERPKFHRQLRASKKKLIELANALKENPNIELTKQFPDIFTTQKMSGEQQVLFINAITNNKAERLVLNIPNNGVVADIPNDVVVEVTCRVDKDGVHPEKVEPKLTDRITRMYLFPRIVRMEIALEAFRTGDIALLEEFLIRDPRTKSQEQARAVLKEILDLPFNKELKAHFGL